VLNSTELKCQYKSVRVRESLGLSGEKVGSVTPIAPAMKAPERRPERRRRSRVEPLRLAKKGGRNE